MRRRNILLASGCAVSLLACSALLGIDELPPSAGVSDASTTDGSSPNGEGGGSDASSTDSGSDAQSGCHEGDKRCSENIPQTCTSNAWVSSASCAAVCSAGACINPPSCAGLPANCGSGDANCCLASHVPGGTFSRSYDQTTYTDSQYKASVSDFVLDDYEVTVARFRKFANDYTKPADGAGKNPNNASDVGWNKAAFDTNLPAAKSDLENTLTVANCAGSTYTVNPGGNETKPVTCMTWYVAFAFCIWDGGRLPTEAEWNYAAAGGGDTSSGQRVYPWSSPSTAVTLDATHATYNVAAPTVVGSLPAGIARWGQSDLAGNVSEWTEDAYVTPYASTSCTDCANLTGTSRVVRGGSYLSGAGTLLLASYRNNSPPGSQSNDSGMRCARAN